MVHGGWMAVDFVTIVSGQSVSSAFTIERSERALWCFVGSHAALGWRLAFGTSLLEPFAPMVVDVPTGAT